MRKIIASIVILCIVNISFLGSITQGQKIKLKAKPSDWAHESVLELIELDIFDQSVFKNYKEDITRKNFIYFAVRIYEAFHGEEIIPDSSIVFKDTDDIYAIKGATVGITSGIGQGNFGPDQLLTREQLAVFMMNTIRLAGIESKPATEYKFADESTFSEWAKESIYLARDNNIINGEGNNIFNPRANATYETVMVICNRILKENVDLIIKEDTLNKVDTSDFIHEIYYDKAIITDYLGTERDIVIPNEIDGLPVVKIADSAFNGNQLTSVVIPSSVKYLGDGVFKDNQIKAIDLGSSLIKIGDYAFDGNDLTSVVIPHSVIEVGRYSFRDNHLSSVDFGDSVARIEKGAFKGNKLTSIKIGDSVKKIGNTAFSNNKISSVIIPNSVTEIGEGAFEDNEITSVKISDSMKKISASTFNDNRLISVLIPDSVIEIGDFAFNDNQINSIVISDSTKTIGESAFAFNQLVSLYIPDSVTLLGDRAFYMNQLSSVEISKSVKSIGAFAFYQNQLTTVAIPKDCRFESNSFDTSVELIEE